LARTDVQPWTIVRSDDKMRGRVNAIRSVLAGLDYPARDIGKIDPKIAGGATLWHV
jgi:hypothetical protein